MKKYKIIRTSTVPSSLLILLKGQLQFLSQHYEVVGISSSGVELQQVEQREGVRTLAVDMERGIHPIKDLISLVRLYKQFKKEKPDVVHSITPKAGLLTMLAGKMAGVPIRMHMFTGLIFPTRAGFMQKLLIKMDQLLCWAATHVYPEGNGVKNDLINYNITKKPLKVLANGNVNGIDLDYFHTQQVAAETIENLQETLGIRPDDFVFIFVGRLVGDKGINELIEAFTKNKLPNSKLLLVGPLETDLDPLAVSTLKEMQQNPHIISVGFQKDVRPYFGLSHALVFPSYREGFPNVVMQAGAMELPSIVTNISGCNEIVQQGVNGTIIPAKDSEALAMAMKTMHKETANYEYMKSNARSMILNRFQQQLVWNAVLDEYKHLLKNRE